MGSTVLSKFCFNTLFLLTKAHAISLNFKRRNGSQQQHTSFEAAPVLCRRDFDLPSAEGRSKAAPHSSSFRQLGLKKLK